ncbi:hypothetical protein pYptb0042 (plasmid) [Yersinia pseudotuberculosis IP 32953]|uniref:Uncharacterized protein n=1 Tax=Yersinia pseudotuberculosis serotype I (strain IP32953) TaxID=273123 RepID=Q663B3_YERPS|nr:hypothetical protein pYptb0042 [Yersinia pseudotuberculosis IP 32953]
MKIKTRQRRVSCFCFFVSLFLCFLFKGILITIKSYIYNKIGDSFSGYK